MLKWNYPLTPNIRSAAKREILMGFSRNFLREARQLAQLLSPKPQHAWAELSPKPQHRYPLTPTTGRFLQKKGVDSTSERNGLRQCSSWGAVTQGLSGSGV